MLNLALIFVDSCTAILRERGYSGVLQYLTPAVEDQPRHSTTSFPLVVFAVQTRAARVLHIMAHTLTELGQVSWFTSFFL